MTRKPFFPTGNSKKTHIRSRKLFKNKNEICQCNFLKKFLMNVSGKSHSPENPGVLYARKTFLVKIEGGFDAFL